MAAGTGDMAWPAWTLANSRLHGTLSPGLQRVATAHQEFQRQGLRVHGRHRSERACHAHADLPQGQHAAIDAMACLFTKPSAPAHFAGACLHARGAAHAARTPRHAPMPMPVAGLSSRVVRRHDATGVLAPAMRTGVPGPRRQGGPHAACLTGRAWPHACVPDWSFPQQPASAGSRGGVMCPPGRHNKEPQ